MGLIIATSGTACSDHSFHPSHVLLRDNSYWIAAGGREFRIELAGPLNGSRKPYARFDRDILNYADRTQFGGGGYNSAVEMRRIAPDIEIRYSDSGTWNPSLAADLARRNITYHCRGLYPTLDNIVTGDPKAHDKLVFRSQPPSQALQPLSDDHVSWFTEAGTGLVNSDKHRAWVTKLASAAARGRLNLHVVLTPALAGDYLIDAVIPNSQLVLAGLDELGAALGVIVRDSIDGGVAALRMLAQRALSPQVHLTLGEGGVLVADPEDMTVLHVRLARAKSREVQSHVRRDRSRVCGSGDCYAGAVTLYSAARRSVFGAGALHRSAFASAAIAGCGAAIRHLGYGGLLSPEDFVVRAAGHLDSLDEGDLIEGQYSSA